MTTATAYLPMTHEAASLYKKANLLARKYGQRDSEGNICLSMTHRAFSVAFGCIDGLRDAIDALEANNDRVGFFILPDAVQIVMNVR